MVYHYWHRLWTGLAGWFSLHQKLAHLHKQHNCRHLTCTVMWLTYGVGKRFHLVRWVVYHSRSGPSLMPLSDWSWYTIQTHTGHRSGSRWLIDLKPVMLIVHTHTNACYSHTHKTHCIPAGILRHHQSMANTNGIPAVWILFIIYLLFFISIGSCVHPFLFIYLLLFQVAPLSVLFPFHVFFLFIVF